MKICPRCQKTYADDNLNFCLEDGSVLQQAGPPPTVQIPAAQMSQQQMPQQTQGTGPGWNVAPQQQYSMQPPRKSSKVWVWVLLILGLVVLVCGGGFAGLVFVGMQQDKQANTQVNVATTNRNSTSRNTSSNSASDTSTTNSNRTNATTVDLGDWVGEESAYGNKSFSNDEFFMSAKQKGFYYVLVAPERYKTEAADTRVTLRNVDNAASSLGYGLIFHSNPTPLQQDYALLIDTKRKKYRVVRHEPSKESVVVSWTSSPAINEGGASNTLEARDNGDKVDLYINGTMVTSIKNLYGYKGGVAGLYSGDGINVAFKNLEIRK